MLLKGDTQDHVVAFIGEFVGTFLFLFFAFAGVQTASENVIPGADPAKLLYISAMFGVSLAVNVWIFFRVSGGLFNPAVTLGLCLVRVVPVVRGLIVFLAQIAGGIVAAVVVKFIIPGKEVLFAVSLGPGVTVAQGFLIEMFMTFELVFTILMLAAEKTKATFLAPIGIGLALFVDHMVGVFWTGAGINPARALGPAVLVKFPGYHWIYWAGPALGAVLAAGLYMLLKTLHYENVNGDQDKSAEEQEQQSETAEHVERGDRSMKNWISHERNTPQQWSAQMRLKEAPETLRLYRLSGLDSYRNRDVALEEGRAVIVDTHNMGRAPVRPPRGSPDQGF